jgi:hypothetical protein
MHVTDRKPPKAGPQASTLGECMASAKLQKEQPFGHEAQPTPHLIFTRVNQRLGAAQMDGGRVWFFPCKPGNVRQVSEVS